MSSGARGDCPGIFPVGLGGRGQGGATSRQMDVLSLGSEGLLEASSWDIHHFASQFCFFLTDSEV